MKNKKGGHLVTGGLKMGVNVAAHTRHIFLGSAPPHISFMLLLRDNVHLLCKVVAPMVHHLSALGISCVF